MKNRINDTILVNKRVIIIRNIDAISSLPSDINLSLLTAKRPRRGGLNLYSGTAKRQRSDSEASVRIKLCPHPKGEGIIYTLRYKQILYLIIG